MIVEGANIAAVMRALADKAAEELEGTCKALHELDEETYGPNFEDSTAFCARLDELVFCCVSCNWWYSMDECNDDTGEWRCDDCTEQDE